MIATPVAQRPAELREALAGAGYAVVDLFDPQTVGRLLTRWENLGFDPRTPFTATSNDLAPNDAEAVHDHVAAVVEPLLEDLLPGSRVFIAGFICRGAGTEAPLELHQDLTYTDEREHRTVLVWAPLVDVADGGGALQVVPGSHRWTHGVRVGGLQALPTSGLQEDLSARAVTLELHAGQAVVYDAALVHGSTPNTRSTARPVVAVATADADAELLHFHHVDGEVVGSLVDADWYRSSSLHTAPEGFPPVAAWAPPVDERELCDAMAGPVRVRAVAPRRTRRPLLPEVGAGALLPPSPRRALLDPGADARLRRDGFVVVPVMDPTSAAQLRSLHALLRGRDGSGFEADLNSDDHAYRARVSQLLAESLDEVVLARFDRYRPYLRNFLCKWPGPDSDLYLHRDWMYVDESAGARSYVVWMPLQDVTGDEGQIQVLRHSHRIDRMLRGTHLNAAWIQHTSTVRERLLTVPVRAGEALVMDNALVHCSLANLSAEPRVVAAVGVRPAECGLVHHRRIDDSTAERHDVPDDFLLTATPARLEAGGDVGGTADPTVVETGEVPLSADELAERLDAGTVARIDRLRRRLRVGAS